MAMGELLNINTACVGILLALVCETYAEPMDTHEQVFDSVSVFQQVVPFGAGQLLSRDEQLDEISIPALPGTQGMNSQEMIPTEPRHDPGYSGVSRISSLPDLDLNALDNPVNSSSVLSASGYTNRAAGWFEGQDLMPEPSVPALTVEVSAASSSEQTHDATDILDIDGDGIASALTDGLLIIRRLFGFTGAALTQDAIGEAATLTDPDEIAIKIDSLVGDLDIDLNGEAGALTDGLMIIRYLFGFTGTSLVDGAVADDATRTDPEDIAAYLEALTPDEVNNPPEVSAGVDQSVAEADLVSLVADVTDETTPVITWSQLSGTLVTLSGTASASAEFTAPQVAATEDLVFQVSVDDGVNSAVVDTVVITVSQAVAEVFAHWLLNTSQRSSKIFESASSGQGVLEDVQSVNPETIAAREYALVEASGIPNYDVQITQEIIAELNARPRLGNDFVSAATTAVLGSTVAFGEDIGYRSSTANCLSTGGDGYWPPGPACPTDQNKQEYLAVEPAPTSSNCETGMGIVGLLVNGTSIYNWGDGQTYGNRVWYNLAPIAEQYDVDICGGHAPPTGDYHHHFYTRCLADLAGDAGDGHSPIYGFGADGYALYGPYESAGVLAVSGWEMRDYGASSSQGGCDTPGQRSCILNDAYDLAQGVDSVTNGPDIGASVSTLSGNTLAATDGYYLEDYYYSADQTSLSYRLDQHNGHDNNDGRGYHYHITLVLDGDKLMPRFPFTFGPRFYGDLPANAMTSCGAAGGPGGPPPKAELSLR
ncbi:MAG: YHYH protein [Gammaproteobacteria bacterium]|nr:YHYH protein [Gammaproteobacteria bacterium]